METAEDQVTVSEKSKPSLGTAFGTMALRCLVNVVLGRDFEAAYHPASACLLQYTFRDKGGRAQHEWSSERRNRVDEPALVGGMVSTGVEYPKKKSDALYRVASAHHHLFF